MRVVAGARNNSFEKFTVIAGVWNRSPTIRTNSYERPNPRIARVCARVTVQSKNLRHARVDRAPLVVGLLLILTAARKLFVQDGERLDLRDVE